MANELLTEMDFEGFREIALFLDLEKIDCSHKMKYSAIFHSRSYLALIFYPLVSPRLLNSILSINVHGRTLQFRRN